MNALFLTLLALQQPTADPVRARLDGSPRHHEWVELDSAGRKLRCFVAFPEVKAKAPAVLVIHENKGLTEWVRALADELAEAGCIALAPDLLSGSAPGGGGTEAFASPDAATQGIYALDAERVRLDLDTVLAHARTLPACDGTVDVAGFCWGGGRAFEYALHAKDLRAAYVFYGTAPGDEAALSHVTCPVYGFYGDRDARITAGLEGTAAAMKAAGKSYEPVVYAGAGHGFMRAGEAPDASEADRKARADAWVRWKALLSRR